MKTFYFVIYKTNEYHRFNFDFVNSYLKPFKTEIINGEDCYLYGVTNSKKCRKSVCQMIAFISSCLPYYVDEVDYISRLLHNLSFTLDEMV